MTCEELAVFLRRDGFDDLEEGALAVAQSNLKQGALGPETTSHDPTNPTRLIRAARTVNYLP